MPKSLKILLMVMVGLVLLYTAIGFWGVPWAITHKLPQVLTEELHRPVAIREAAFNPFLFKLQVKGFALEESNGSPLAGFDELFVDFEPLASIKAQAYTFAQIRLGLPYGLAVIRPDGSLNLADLGPPPDESLAESPSSDPASDEPAELPPVFVQQIQIQQGMVEFRDLSRPTPFMADVVPINLSLEKFTTQQGQANPYSLSAELSEGERIGWEGTVTLEPFQSEGDLVLEGIRLDSLWAYLQDQFHFAIPQGLLTVKGHYEVAAAANGADVQVREGRVTLHDLAIQEKGAPESVISLPLLDLQGVRVNVAKQSVRIPSVTAQDARFVGWLDERGDMNYQSLFTPIEADGESSADSAEAPSDAEPWSVVIDDLDWKNFTIEFEDRQPAPPVRMVFDAVHFHTSQVSSTLEDPLPIDLSFNFNDTGKANLKGTVAIEPLSVELDLALADIALQPFAPYLDPFVQFAVDGGVLTLEGQTHYQDGVETEPMVTFAGALDISQVALVDPASAKPFLQWDGLNLKDLALTVEPTTVSLDEVALVNPSVKVSLDPDGGLNVTRLFTPPGQSDDTTSDDQEETGKETEGPVTPVKIQTVRLENFQASIADLSITPNVVTKIKGLTGTIKGLSSDQLAKADVSITGNVDGYSPVKIEGQINPLSEDAYTDLVMSFKNLDLTTVSPYSGRFAGYPITKGKLTLDLDYKLSQKELIGENKVLIDQMTMGSRVDSPDATSLPIPLALALLKDRKGKIDIDLPIRGNLDDPEFSYGGLILQALVNLITKVATSPFSIVGGLVGGIVGGDSDNLQYVAFPGGSSELSSDEEEKLGALSKALADRPGLRLEITGAVDPSLDGRAMAEAALLAQLKKAKFVEQPPSDSQSQLGFKDIELTPGEEAQYLIDLYKKQFSETAPVKTDSESSGENAEKKGSQGLTVEAMKAALVKDMKVDDGQLRLLAQQRAQHVRDYLIQQASFPSDRIFLVEVSLSPVVENDLVRSPMALAAN